MNFNKYIVFPDGKIYSTVRKIFLRQAKTKHGYMKVTLCTEGKPTTYNTHTLVAKVFVPNLDPENYKQVNHIDGDKTNNNDWNLEWVDAKRNISHSISQGLKPDIRGEKNKSSKLLNIEVSHIKKELLARLSDSEIAKRFKVDRSTIYKIRNGRTWRHI